jgi:hypothetical protein
MYVHVIARILGLCTNAPSAVTATADASAWWRERATSLEARRQMDHAEMAAVKAENARLRDDLARRQPGVLDRPIGIVR